MLQMLRDANIPVAELRFVRRYTMSDDASFCAVTLENDESYVADLRHPSEGRFLHYPRAGIAGFVGNRVRLDPDEVRFNLEPAGFESFEVDLLDPALPWRG